MPAKRLSMRTIKEVLRLKWSKRLSNRRIASSCGIARPTVSEYLRRAESAGLTWPLPASLDDTRLERLLFPPPPHLPAPVRGIPDWARAHQELKQKGVTLFLLWQEYRAGRVRRLGVEGTCTGRRRRVVLHGLRQAPMHASSAAAGSEGRGPTAHARQWADDEVRTDPSDCAEAIPTRRARRRTRGEDDARPDGGVSRRWRPNRNPRLRQLLAPFPPGASRAQPQNRYAGVASGQAGPFFQARQETARTRQWRVSWVVRSAAARGRIRRSLRVLSS